MKTSLLIDDKIFYEAKKQALQIGKTVSEIISLWARVGHEEWMKRKQKKRKEFKAVNLCEQRVDLSNRKNWMEELEDDRG
ncbi:hypothetical protein HZA26_03495 [Candidatus Nomurabacteria bacterium]|nr:hypothetical protein [Candidatus Nomurabacteria bacterium]